MEMQQDKYDTFPRSCLMRAERIIWVTLIVCIVFLLAGCGIQNQTTSQPQATKINTVVMTSSWAEYYKTLKDLKAHADVAVQGTFTGILRTVVDPKEQVYTNFSFSVTKTVYEHRTLSPSVITIRQEGGLYKNTFYRESGDPVFQVGEQSFLFLREASPGLYVVIGGPSGRFIVQNGSVTPIAKDAVQLPVSTSISGFASTIQKTS